MNKSSIEKIKKVYLIGVITPEITLQCRINYFNTQTLLELHGFKVCNPLEDFQLDRHVAVDFFKANVRKMMACDAVYVLPDVSLSKGECTELQIAIDLNLIIIQQLLHTCDAVAGTAGN